MFLEFSLISKKSYKIWKYPDVFCWEYFPKIIFVKMLQTNKPYVVIIKSWFYTYIYIYIYILAKWVGSLGPKRAHTSGKETHKLTDK